MTTTHKLHPSLKSAQCSCMQRCSRFCRRVGAGGLARSAWIQIDRQIQIDRKINRQKDRQIERPTDRQAKRQTDRQTNQNERRMYSSEIGRLIKTERQIDILICTKQNGQIEMDRKVSNLQVSHREQNFIVLKGGGQIKIVKHTYTCYTRKNDRRMDRQTQIDRYLTFRSRIASRTYCSRREESKDRYS